MHENLSNLSSTVGFFRPRTHTEKKKTRILTKVKFILAWVFPRHTHNTAATTSLLTDCHSLLSRTGVGTANGRVQRHSCKLLLVRAPRQVVETARQRQTRVAGEVEGSLQRVQGQVPTLELSPGEGPDSQGQEGGQGGQAGVIATTQVQWVGASIQ